MIFGSETRSWYGIKSRWHKYTYRYIICFVKEKNMSPNINNTNHTTLIKFLKQKEFILKRTKWNHYFFYNPNTKHITTVPFHKKNPKIGTLLSILKQAWYTKQDFLESTQKLIQPESDGTITVYPHLFPFCK